MTKQDFATKDDLLLLESRLNTRIDISTSETLRQMLSFQEENRKLAAETRQHFDVVAENMHYDLIRGALHDKVSQHDDRILALEMKVGIK